MAEWMIVLNNTDSLNWVLSESRMAFRKSVDVSQINKGDRFVIYTTRGIYGRPENHESQIVAHGTFTGPTRRGRILIGAAEYHQECPVVIATQLPQKRGVSFRELVPHLRFIRKKH